MKRRYLLSCILIVALLLTACSQTPAEYADQPEEPVLITGQEDAPSTETEEPSPDPAPAPDTTEEDSSNSTSSTVKSLALCEEGVLYVGEQGLMLYNGNGAPQMIKEGVRRVQTVGGTTLYVTEDGIYRYKDHLKICDQTDFSLVADDGEKLLLYRANDGMLMIFDGQSTTLSKALQGEIKYGTFFYKDGTVHARGFDINNDQFVVTTVREDAAETVAAEACYVTEDSVYLLQNGAILKDGKPLVKETEATLLAVTDYAVFGRQDNGRLIRYDLTGKAVETIENVTHLACTKEALICRQGDERLLKITQNGTETYDGGDTVLSVYANDSFIAAASYDHLLLITSDGTVFQEKF